MSLQSPQITPCRSSYITYRIWLTSWNAKKHSCSSNVPKLFTTTVHRVFTLNGDRLFHFREEPLKFSNIAASLHFLSTKTQILSGRQSMSAVLPNGPPVNSDLSPPTLPQQHHHTLPRQVLHACVQFHLSQPISHSRIPLPRQRLTRMFYHLNHYLAVINGPLSEVRTRREYEWLGVAIA